MKIIPPVVISGDFNESYQAALKHAQEIKKTYGNQFWINLIDKKKEQLPLGTEFTKLVNNLKDKDMKSLDYTWFDFHGECAKMKWENLSKLVMIVNEQLKSFSHFSAEVNLGGPSDDPRNRKY